MNGVFQPYGQYQYVIPTWQGKRLGSCADICIDETWKSVPADDILGKPMAMVVRPFNCDDMKGDGYWDPQVTNRPTWMWDPYKGHLLDLQTHPITYKMYQYLKGLDAGHVVQRKYHTYFFDWGVCGQGERGRMYWYGEFDLVVVETDTGGKILKWKLVAGTEGIYHD